MRKLTGLLLLLFTFTFAGCEVNETPGKGGDTPINNKESYTIKFMIEDKLIQETIIEKGNTVGSYYPTLEEGQSFENWYSDAALSSVFDFSTTIEEDTILYGSILLDPVEADFDTIRTYLYENGDYSYINEPGREAESYKMHVDADGIRLHMVLEILIEQPENIESITTTLILPDQSGFVGIYLGTSGTKQEYADGIMHVFNGATDEDTMKWYGVECENYDISNVDTRTCTTFQNEATINNFFYTLKSDNLHLVIEKANNYFEEVLGVTLH